MKISAKTDYACRAILELSLHWPNSEPLSIHAISERQNIPFKFLIQILLNLKQLGLAQSIRGKKGGYILGKAPYEITLREIIQNFSEGNLKSFGQNNFSHTNIFEPIWQEAGKRYFDFLEEQNFEVIVQREKKLVEVPMYMI